MARLTALAPDGVGPISPGPRSAWGEFREDPVLFARSRPQVLLIPLVFVVFVGAWEWVVRAWSIPAFLVPAPSMVASALSRGVRSGLYLTNFWATLYEALMGFVIAAVSGIMLGAVIAQFRVVERTFYPYLVALQTLPKIAIAPLVIVWFGFGISSKVIIAATVAFFPVLVNVIVGLKTIDPAKLDLMRSLRASRWQTFRLVTFPNALPFVFAGLDIAIVFSVLGAIVGEFVGAQQGLGNLILQFNVALDIAGVFAVLILLSVMGVALHLIMQAVQKHIIFWAEPDEIISA
jgi:NitT/TauT family transport system permease protein